MDAHGRLQSTIKTLCVTPASGVLGNFPSKSITQWMDANDQPIIIY